MEEMDNQATPAMGDDAMASQTPATPDMDANDEEATTDGDMTMAADTDKTNEETE